jgi:hypothetical protein
MVGTKECGKYRVAPDIGGDGHGLMFTGTLVARNDSRHG